MTRLLRSLSFFAVLIIAWEAASCAGWWSPVLVPSPLSIGKYLVASTADGTLLSAGIVTMTRLGIGYVIGLLLGIPLGLLTARFRFAADTLGVLALGLQTLPSVCWVPLSLLSSPLG